MIALLQSTYAEMYSAHRELSVDETVIGIKCKLSFIQFMKAKLTMWGVKVWISADSRNAYISAFDIYTGDIFSEDLTIKTKGSYVLPP